MGRPIRVEYPLAGQGGNHCSEVADLYKNHILKQTHKKLTKVTGRHQYSHYWVMGFEVFEFFSLSI